MLVRYILLGLLVAFLARALVRLFAGFREGLTGVPRGTRVPPRGVQMVRDPVCGTFVVPDRAVLLTEGVDRVHFCSKRCRDQYQARVK
jgi:hypothetical protein